MGNFCFNNKVKKHEKPFVIPTVLSKATASVTIPSICSTTSFDIGPSRSGSGCSSHESFNWTRIQSLCFNQDNNIERMTTPTLHMTIFLLDLLKRNLKYVCAELADGTVKLHESIIETFNKYYSAKNVHKEETCVDIKKIICHFVSAVYIHDLVLTYFENGNKELALDYLKQVAVSHALMGVSPFQFQMFDWFIINYLIKNKIISDESIGSLIIYLNIVTNCITSFYESQSTRQHILGKLTSLKHENHRQNKARENFRIMKKWKIETEVFHEQEEYVNQLIEQAAANKGEDERTIDTEILKANDCIMKHFVNKK